MDQVRKVLDWMKRNPLTVVCGVVMLLALVSFFWLTLGRAASLRQDMEARKKVVSTLEGLQRSPMIIPPKSPDDPPVQVVDVINDAANDRLKTIHELMEQQFLGLYTDVTAYNQRNHEPMIDGLFPKPVDIGRPFTARTQYIAAFGKLYRDLGAGTPPTKEEIDTILARQEEIFRNQFKTGSQLTPEQDKALKRIQADKLQDMFRAKAGRINIYADEVILRLGGEEPMWAPGPFHIGAWAQSGERPHIDDLWEAQMQLWIQKDLLTAIAVANGILTENLSPSSSGGKSVPEAPVKRLKLIRVYPGYVGVPANGVERETYENMTKYNEGRITKLKAELESRIPDNFKGSPTGRISNPLYDVRHAVMRVVVEAKDLPQLINAVSKVNLMTIIGMEVREVDAFEDFRSGYFYGDMTDPIEVDLKVESIWLRTWTAGHLDVASAKAQLDALAGLKDAGVRIPAGFDPVIEQYKLVTGDESKLAFVRENFFQRGLMPDGVRWHLGLPIRDAAFNPEENAKGRSNTGSRGVTDFSRTPDRNFR